MVEPQPSKLVMRVRFPSPAPTRNPRSAWLSSSVRAGIKTRGPFVVPVLRARPALGPTFPPGRSEQLAHRRGDRLVPLPGGVLVDQSGTGAGMAHPLHQLAPYREA